MTSNANQPQRTFDVLEVRRDFPILQEQVRGTDLVYLDNAATTQKPNAVIESLSDYYRHSNANIHRAVHYLGEKATVLYESARETIRQFIGASEAAEIIFTRGTTEAINLVAHSLASSRLKPGDEILISAMEHHSNTVPWQLACKQSGAILRVIPMDTNGELMLDRLPELLTSQTALVAVTQVSNALGTVNDVKRIIDLCHAQNVLVLIDGAQAVQHLSVDVNQLGADFYTFSGHKIYGPTGIGVLYAKKAIMEQLPPYQGGGDMIRSVSFEESTWNDLPYKFEAGTPDIAGAIGLAEALKYLGSFSMAEIRAHEDDLITYATQRLQGIDRVRIIGNAAYKTGALSFIVEDVHPHDLGTFLDHDGVAIRTGHHCAQPVMDFYGIPATARASFAMYNTRDDVDRFANSLARTIKILL